MQGRWNLDVNAVMKGFRGSVMRKAEEVTQRVYDGVTARSPVFTGQFRASWNISQGVPNLSTIDFGGEKGSPIGLKRQIAKATTEVPIFYVSNGKPYGQKLENGSSNQAPLGVVRVTLAGIQ